MTFSFTWNKNIQTQQQNQQQQQPILLHPKRKKSQQQQHQHSFLHKLPSFSRNQHIQEQELEQICKKQQKQNKNRIVVQNSSITSGIIRGCSLLLFVLSLYNFYNSTFLLCYPYQLYYYQICITKLLRVQQTYKSLIQLSQSQQQSNNNNTNSNTIKINNTSTNKNKLRILYCITSLNEYNTGRRSTIKGYNRFTNIIIPIIQQSIQSFLLQNDDNGTASTSKNSSTTIDIDLYIISNYTISYKQYQLVRSIIPSCVNIQIWDNATPLGYSVEAEDNSNRNTTTTTNTKKLQHMVQSLARQHRYVIKDNLLYYDIFVNFEDDMLVQYEHVSNYIHVSNLIQQLRNDAIQREQQNQEQEQTITYNNSNNFYGQYMSSQSLSRIIPGFIRVEVASTNPYLNTINNIQQQSAKQQQQQQQRKLKFNLPTYYLWNNINKNNEDSTTIDPSICCEFTRPMLFPNTSVNATTGTTTNTYNSLLSFLSNYLSRNSILSTPSSSSPSVATVSTEANEIITNPTEDQLYFWETDIKALGIRQMPNITTRKLMSSSSLQQTQQQVQQQEQLDWVLLQGGCTNAIYEQMDQEVSKMKSISQVQSKSSSSESYLSRYGITDFWTYDESVLRRTTNTSNNKRKYKYKRPDSTLSKYNNNQGGWIGTQEQIIEWNNRWCRNGGLLPPYSLQYYRNDGLTKYTVEYWSGGIQLFGSNSCNLQRIILLHPYHFSKSLLYHTSNNKQLTQIVQHRFISIQQFWGQLNYIKTIAQEIIIQNKEK